jgi:hypothetical protein
VPVVLPQPPPPCSGGGGRDRAAWGIVDAVTVAVAVARQIRIRQTRGRRSPAQAGLSTPVDVGLRVPTVPVVLPPPSSTPLGRRRVQSRRAGDCRCRRHRRRAAPSEEDSCTPPSSTARCPRRHSAHCDARSARRRGRSEFYHHRRGNSESTNDEDNDTNHDNEGATRRRKRRRTRTDYYNPSSFASQNIPLPADDNAALPDQLLRQSKSLLEQVALLDRRQCASSMPRASRFGVINVRGMGSTDCTTT